MASIVSRTIVQGPNDAGRRQDGDETAVALEVLGPDLEGARLGVIIQVDPKASHAVRIALGDAEASARHAAWTLRPGEAMDTTTIPAEAQPRGAITAYTDSSEDVDAQLAAARGEQNLGGAPGELLLNVTEFTR